jgi:hypothetical protein
MSKCTKQCGGGVQSRSRQVVTKPKNGGTPCEGPNESLPCNTGSCDANCKLAAWTNWGPCTQACGGGVKTRIRKMVKQKVGAGKVKLVTGYDYYFRKMVKKKVGAGKLELISGYHFRKMVNDKKKVGAG